MLQTTSKECTTHRLPEHEQRVIYIFGDHWTAFQELVQRGSNLWPDAPKEIKELSDLITNGKIMQEYPADRKS